MARGLNKVMLIGHLGNDPERRETASGQSVVNFTLATSEGFKDSSGNFQERTEWHRIVAWGKLADICSQYLKKGRQVYIEGRLQTRSWEDNKTGEKKYTTEIVCSDMQMLGSKDSGGGMGDSSYSQERQQSSRPSRPEPSSGNYGERPASGGAQDFEKDDLPF
ncbi:single-stranded DNA-binding protein [Chlorobaculum sp. 24CR]|jgi:single-strand DNA-binding protein|uniref:single-stranded DNA-binding protein n=1 Tax=Chlorobaculum sp. 24CR TaxID=2508878 RepID=UPI00100BC5EF|nr:single-stranded DNA-binding protein [Chlorobaculum sp. 24CR]RXK89436.1 single-stranded DNA-binding protein [Chlorobaculum sp. 24CR]